MCSWNTDDIVAGFNPGVGFSTKAEALANLDSLLKEDGSYGWECWVIDTKNDDYHRVILKVECDDRGYLFWSRGDEANVSQFDNDERPWEETEIKVTEPKPISIWTAPEGPGEVTSEVAHQIYCTRCYCLPCQCYAEFQVTPFTFTTTGTAMDSGAYPSPYPTVGDSIGLKRLCADCGYCEHSGPCVPF